MELITTKSKAASAADAWDKQYGARFSSGTLSCGKKTADISQQLRALTDPTPEQVNDIIGNTSWTECRCSECERKVEAVVQVGEEPDYETQTAWLCADCIEQAYLMIKGQDAESNQV